jgi:MerR family transcriptional regulator, copper efflux regulator
MLHLQVRLKVNRSRPMLTIGALARQAGVRTSAVRYYESEGILRPAGRLANGYRVYGDEAVSSLRFLRRAQALGISLKEVKQLLRLAGDGRRPCGRVRELVREHLEDIELKIRELTALRSQLERLLRLKPARRRAGEVCPIIERGV